jgi:hypothetical protein
MVPVLDLEISKTSGWFQFHAWKFPRFRDGSSFRPGNFQDFGMVPVSDSGNFLRVRSNPHSFDVPDSRKDHQVTMKELSEVKAYL